MFLQKMKNHDGFTLVELIVVIAIMAILAGVAVPAYSGYIEKADAAADSVLLDAVNNAFVASVIENGGDPFRLSSASAPISGGKVTSVSAYAAGLDSKKVNESFGKYFTTDNGEAVFKSITQLIYIQKDGMFKDPVTAANDPNSGVKAYDYAGGTLYLTDAQIQALGNSTFITGEDMSVEALLGKVDFVADFASSLESDALDKVLGSDEYMKSMILALGGSITGLEDSEAIGDAFYAEVEKAALKHIEKLGVTLPDKATDEEAYYEALNPYTEEIGANMAVLYAAQNASKQSNTDIMNVLTAENPKQAILNTLNGKNGVTQDTGKAMGDAALLYGMYTAFAHSAEYGSSTRQDTASKPMDVMSSLQGDELKAFQEYIDSDQGKKDLDGYIASMNMINSSANDPDALADVLNNGFNNKDLITLIQGALTKSET